MKILILGATGLLGHCVYKAFGRSAGFKVFGTLRNRDLTSYFPSDLRANLLECSDLEDNAQLTALLDHVTPDVVINCLSISKPELTRLDPLKILSLYSLLPKKLSSFCAKRGARLIQISSDGVFSGKRGNYTEEDCPDATDIYGIAKALGELDAPHTVTLRTSMIGHELHSKYGLLEWFLSQQGSCQTHAKSIFSGLPAVTIARIIRDVVISDRSLTGIYHLAARPISKHDLLSLIAEVYQKPMKLIPDDRIVIDRSLSPHKFYEHTGFMAESWAELIKEMHQTHVRTEITYV